MPPRKDPPRAAQALAAGAAVFVVVTLLNFTGAFHLLELKTRDLRMKGTLAEKLPPTPEIAVMVVTDESIQWVARQTKKAWPWPRELFGDLFRACALGKARGICFDFFTHIDRDSSGTESQWAEAIAKAPPAWLATPFSVEPSPEADAREDLDALLAKYAISVDSDGSVAVPAPYSSVQLPQPVVARAVAGVADVSTPRDVDGVLRDYRMLVKFRGKYYPSFALAALLVREKASGVRIRDGRLLVGSVALPLGKEATLRLRFYPRFQAMPASAVIAGLWSIEDDKKVTSFTPANVENRFVFIGPTAAALFDLKVTPVTDVLPGIELHATALQNILDASYLRDVPPAVSLALLAALSLGAALMTRFASAGLGGAASAALLAATIAASTGLFHARWVADLVAPVTAIVLAYAATSALNYLYEGRQKQRVKRDFQRYFSPLVVEKILKTPDALSLEGERKELTIFFMDFAGFTAMSEKLDPSELVKLMNEYHNEAAEEIFRTEGTIDKYIGDAIMAFWNDPLPQADHALRACLTAVGTQVRLKEMARLMRERGMPEMRARIGINSGIATVGNFGAKRQVNYTLIGDEVNLASRLEGVNKEFGTDIIVSEATFAPAKDRLEARELALIKVKGKKLPVRIFELLSLKGELAPERRELVGRFAEALADFRARRFQKAWEAFLPLSQKGDGPSDVYTALCERYRVEAPPADWDGSYQMDHK